MNKVVTLKINEKEYSFGFPTVGEFCQIETMKQMLSRGNYSIMLASPMTTTQVALDMIDIEATLTVMCPDLIKDLKVDSISKLDIRDFKVIRKAYDNAVVPFFKEVMEALNPAKMED